MYGSSACFVLHISKQLGTVVRESSLCMGDRYEFKFFTWSCQTSLALAGTGTTAGVPLPTAAADVLPESFTSSYMIILIVR